MVGHRKPCVAVISTEGRNLIRRLSIVRHAMSDSPSGRNDETGLRVEKLNLHPPRGVQPQNYGFDPCRGLPLGGPSQALRRCHFDRRRIDPGLSIVRRADVISPFGRNDELGLRVKKLNL
ncbi:hypothetical protein HS125_03250 [bacterium]|nr:hypothetical protein [bacterium]